MQHRNQAADERRRRMLLDESCSSLPARTRASRADSRDDAARRARSYTSAARCGRQPRLTDLIPKRWPALSALVILGGLAIGSIGWLAQRAADWGEVWGPRAEALFAPAAFGSLARWLASLWLLGVAAISVIIYTLRRHKADDYRGSYRTWLWAAGIFILASFDATTSAHRLLGDVLMHQFGTPLGGNGSLWWIGTWGVLLAAVGLRLLWDMRSSRTALAAGLVAGSLYAAVAASVIWPSLPAAIGQEGLSVSLTLLSGHFFWLLAFTFNARYVFLDSQGLIAVREESTPSGAAGESARPARLWRLLFWWRKSAEEKEAAWLRKAEAKEAARQRKADERDAARQRKADQREARRKARMEARQAPKEKKQAQQQSDSAAKQSRRERKAAAAASRSQSAAESRSAATPAASQQNGDSSGQRLSKAERKRLKKQRRRELREQAV